MPCRNTIEQTVPNGYDHKTIIQACGTTSIHGTAQYCDECESKHLKQGSKPNCCKHGYNIYDEYCNHADCN